MTDRERLIAQIVADEGTGPMRHGRFFPYTDTVGRVTIGYGRNLSDTGISQATADQMLGENLNEAIVDLSGPAFLPWFPALDPVRRRAVVELRFNLGPQGWRSLTTVIALLAAGAFVAAAADLAQTKWATQVSPTRRDRIIRMLGTGEA